MIINREQLVAEMTHQVEGVEKILEASRKLQRSPQVEQALLAIEQSCQEMRKNIENIPENAIGIR